MTGVLSDAHRDHRVNGHRIEGLADVERPIQLPDDVELFVVNYGADGGMYARDLPRFGGMVTYRVFPTSVTTGWAINERLKKDNASRDGTPHTFYEATDRQIVQGLTLSLEGGILKRCPQGIEAGQPVFEFVIEYEVIVPNPVGATWTRSPLRLG